MLREEAALEATTVLKDIEARIPTMALRAQVYASYLLRSMTTTAIEFSLFDTYRREFGIALTPMHPERFEEHPQSTLLYQTMAASFAAASTELFRFPLSKHAAQLETIKDSKTYKIGGGLPALKASWAKDGLTGLYRGLPTAVLGCVVSRGWYLGIYNSSSWGMNSDSLLRKAITAYGAAAVACVLEQPFLLAQTAPARMVAIEIAKMKGIHELAVKHPKDLKLRELSKKVFLEGNAKIKAGSTPFTMLPRVWMPAFTVDVPQSLVRAVPQAAVLIAYDYGLRWYRKMQAGRA
jgi:hypothetical protein